MRKEIPEKSMILLLGQLKLSIKSPNSRSTTKSNNLVTTTSNLLITLELSEMKKKPIIQRHEQNLQNLVEFLQNRGILTENQGRRKTAYNNIVFKEDISNLLRFLKDESKNEKENGICVIDCED